MTTQPTDTLATLRAFYHAAVSAPGEARESVRTGRWYSRVLCLHAAGEARAKIEEVTAAFQRLQSMWTVEAQRAESATMRAAWETGDRAAFYAAVVASRQLDSGHGPNADGDLWASAMTLCYRDAADWKLAEIERRIPARLDTQERDTERYAESRGLLCRIEMKESHLYWARQAAGIFAETVATA